MKFMHFFYIFVTLGETAIAAKMSLVASHFSRFIEKAITQIYEGNRSI